MAIDEEIRAYLAGLMRRNRLAQLEHMAARPTLAQRRAARPRLGIVRRLVRFIVGR